MRRAIAALVAAAALLALLPGAASAKPGYRKTPGYRVLQPFPAQGTNGYEIYIGVAGGRAYLAAISQSREGGSSVIYQRKQRQAGDKSIEIDLGKAGRVKAHFVSERVEEVTLPKGCVGKPAVAETGAFVGSFNFHGADGFTSLSTHRIKGAFTESPSEICPRHPGLERKFAPRRGDAVLRAIAGARSGSTSFEAVAEPRLPGIPATSTYEAHERHREGALEITESVDATAPSPLAIPNLTGQLPATITFEPPAPFSGSATLEAPSRATATWSGDLAVDFPAAGEVPLTGPGIDAGLCRDRTCSASLPKALQPGQEAGYVHVYVQEPGR
jgi:hypothetical protein